MASKKDRLKIVYYGVGVAGKFTSCEYLYSMIHGHEKWWKEASIANGLGFEIPCEEFRTIHIQCALSVNSISLITVPRSIVHDPARREVLKDVDGLVVVIDSQHARLAGNIEAFKELEDYLGSYGRYLADVPWVIQYNKRDLPNILSFDELENQFNRSRVPAIESVATQGIGVCETLQCLCCLLEKKIFDKNGVWREG